MLSATLVSLLLAIFFLLMKAQQSYTPPVPASIQDHRSDAIGNVNGRARNLPRTESQERHFRYRRHRRRAVNSASEIRSSHLPLSRRVFRSATWVGSATRAPQPSRLAPKIRAR